MQRVLVHLGSDGGVDVEVRGADDDQRVQLDAVEARLVYRHLARAFGESYDADHPEVECGCGERFTACDLGNHYCPSCGESADSATPVTVDTAVEGVCKGCPCLETGGSPCCWCDVRAVDHP